jgi:hypothetical protein
MTCVARLSPRDEITVNDADDEVGRLRQEFTELRTLLPTLGRIQRGNVRKTRGKRTDRAFSVTVCPEVVPVTN